MYPSPSRFIRTTLSQDDLVVRKVHVQEKIPGVGYKGVVFDALCIDSCGNMYDVEVQKGHFEDLPKRAEFYEAMLTVHSLEVGSHGYADMPHRCVIFICDGDIVGKGRPVYDYRWRLEDGEELGNGGRGHSRLRLLRHMDGSTLQLRLSGQVVFG